MKQYNFYKIKKLNETATLRNGIKVSQKMVTPAHIDNEIESRFFGVEKTTDTTGKIYWVVDNPNKAVLTITYDPYHLKDEPLYKISIMRKAKIISAWEGNYTEDLRKDITEASEDWSFITPYNFSEKIKEAFYHNEYGEECNPEDIGYQRIDYSDNEEDIGYSFNKKYKLVYEANEDIYWVCKYNPECDRWTKVDFAKEHEDYLKTLIKRYKIETNI